MNKTRDRLNRGGCWDYDDATDLAARARFGDAPSYRSRILGFRCVRGGTYGLRVNRGGSWLFNATERQAVGRDHCGGNTPDNYLGFRCWRNKE